MAAGIVPSQRRRPAHRVDGRPLFRGHLGQYQRAFCEVEGGEADLAGQRRARGAPMQPSCDHEMNDKVQLSVERDDDALAQPGQPAHDPAAERRQRRFDGAQHERAAEPHALQRLAQDPTLERLDVDGDVGQFRHGPAMLSCRAWALKAGAGRNCRGALQAVSMR
jgi:hypothetical protein